MRLVAHAGPLIALGGCLGAVDGKFGLTLPLGDFLFALLFANDSARILSAFAPSLVTLTLLLKPTPAGSTLGLDERLHLVCGFGLDFVRGGQDCTLVVHLHHASEGGKELRDEALGGPCNGRALQGPQVGAHMVSVDCLVSAHGHKIINYLPQWLVSVQGG